MKYLQDYQEKKQSELFEKTGSFFAFGDKQFNEAKKEGVKYVSLGAGLICPKENVDLLLNGLKAINKKAIAKDLKENGKEAIIIRELYNHECFYVGDILNAIEALKPYGFSDDEIREAYNKEYPKVEF